MNVFEEHFSNELLEGEYPWEKRQDKALKLALTGHPLIVIKGPPGTGKSTVIVGIIRRLAREGKRILFVAPTHVALDEVLQRLHILLKDNMEKEVHAARVVPQRNIQIPTELRNYVPGKLGQLAVEKALQELKPFLDKSQELPNQIGEIYKLRKEIRGLMVIKMLKKIRLEADLEYDRIQSENIQLQNRIESINEQDKNSRSSNHSQIIQSLSLTKDDRESIPQKIISLQQKFNIKNQEFELLQEKIIASKNDLQLKEELLIQIIRELDVHKDERQTRSDSFQYEGSDDEIDSLIQQIKTNKQEITYLINQNKELRSQLSPFCESNKALQSWFDSLKTASLIERRAMSQYYEDKKQQKHEAVAQIHIIRPVIQNNQLQIDGLELNVSNDKKLLKNLRDQKRKLQNMDYKIVAIEHNVEWMRRDIFKHSECIERQTKKIESQNTQLQFYAQNINAMESKYYAIKQHEESYRIRHELKQVSLSIESLGNELKSKQAMKAIVSDLQHKLAPQFLAHEDEIDKMIYTTHRMLSTAINMAGAGTIRKNLAQRWTNWLKQPEAKDRLQRWSIKRLNLITATTQGIANSSDFRDDFFDVLICDECSRVTRGEILVPASRCKRVILVGDENQLPPYIEPFDELTTHAFAAVTSTHKTQNNDLSETNIHESVKRMSDLWNIEEQQCRPIREENVVSRAKELLAFFDGDTFYKKTEIKNTTLKDWLQISNALTSSSLDHILNFIPKERVVRLNIQRRMPDEIASLVRIPVYNGDFKTGDDIQTPPLATEIFHGPIGFFNTQHMTKARSGRYMDGLLQKGTSFINIDESKLVVKIVKQHLSKMKTSESVMIITFYLAQAKTIKEQLEPLHKNLKVLPIDRCQGQEADLVVISLVRSNPNPREGYGLWLQDHRRLNVALTRARRKLVIVGNLQMFRNLKGNEKGRSIIESVISTSEKHPEWVAVSS